MVELLLAGHDARGLSRRGLAAGMTGIIRPVEIGNIFSARPRLYTGNSFDGACDAAEEATEIRNVDEGQQQARHPENMHVREERYQAEDRNNLELDLVAFVRDALGQCVQAQEENAEADHCDSKGDRHDDHEHIGLARCGNKKGQMFGRSGMRRLSRRGIGGEARRRS